MAAFRFRLASVVRFRERVKQEKQWELALLNGARRKLEDEILNLNDELLQADASTVVEEGFICSVLDLRLRGDYARVVARRIHEKRDALSELDKKLAAKREELVEAMRAVKILEQLRQRLEEKFRRDREIAEQKFTDEIGLRKFIDPNKG
jgi:flagellar export protein FliJ